MKGIVLDVYDDGCGLLEFELPSDATDDEIAYIESAIHILSTNTPYLPAKRPMRLKMADRQRRLAIRSWIELARYIALHNQSRVPLIKARLPLCTST